MGVAPLPFRKNPSLLWGLHNSELRASLSRVPGIPEARDAATSGTMRSYNGLLLLTVKKVLEPK